MKVWFAKDMRGTVCVFTKGPPNALMEGAPARVTSLPEGGFEADGGSGRGYCQEIHETLPFLRELKRGSFVEVAIEPGESGRWITNEQLNAWRAHCKAQREERKVERMVDEELDPDCDPEEPSIRL